MRQLLELCVWQVVADDVCDPVAVVVRLKAASMQRLQDTCRTSARQVQGNCRTSIHQAWDDVKLCHPAAAGRPTGLLSLKAQKQAVAEVCMCAVARKTELLLATSDVAWPDNCLIGEHMQPGEGSVQADAAATAAAALR